LSEQIILELVQILLARSGSQEHGEHDQNEREQQDEGQGQA
jgi:hypothetical protein